MADEVLVCELDGVQFAIPAAQVSEVLRAVLILPSPFADDEVIGVIDRRGQLLAVFNLWAALGVQARGVTADDSFVVITSSWGELVLPASQVERITGLKGDYAAALRGDQELVGHSELSTMRICPADFFAGSISDLLIKMSRAQAEMS